MVVMAAKFILVEEVYEAAVSTVFQFNDSYHVPI